mmetsp:Transcript_31949/g.101877  ORF Transcript_31949/g.101877 Transcript_31949/m.101877 type:complete len:533 (-) Transcript_31949:223-1821(-)
MAEKRPRGDCMRSSSIGVGDFYGKKSKEEELFLFRLSHQTTKLRRAEMRKFKLQRDAFEFLDSQQEGKGMGDEWFVFGEEKNGKGKRKFFVTSQAELWRIIKETFERGEIPHMYEVIREGCPAYLYFDIEFNKRWNPEVNGECCMETFENYLCEFMRKYFSTRDLQVNNADIIHLDSSNENKFSRHLIVRPNDASVVFRDNVQMGEFVRALVQNIENDLKQGNEELLRLFVFVDEQMDKENKKIFVDLGVYTKNRCFRVYLNSKFGKKTILVPVNDRRSIDELLRDESLFYKTLVCPRLKDPASFTFLEVVGDDQGRGCAAASCTQVMKSSQHLTSESWKSLLLSDTRTQVWEQVGEYIISFWNERAGGVNGKICALNVMDEEETIVNFRVVGNRWCDNIGRQHRSNGIMLIANRQKGVFYQKCFDPDCRQRDARSNDFPIPAALLHGTSISDQPELEEEWDEALFTCIDKLVADTTQRRNSAAPSSPLAILQDDDLDAGALTAIDQAVSEYLRRKETNPHELSRVFPSPSR